MNLWAYFRALLPQSTRLVGLVLSHNADGTSSVELPSGVSIRAQGQSVDVGHQAFVQGGRVVGDAPTLPTYEAEV